MTKTAPLLLAAALLVPGLAIAAPAILRTGPTGVGPVPAEAAIASMTVVPPGATTAYIAGATPGAPGQPAPVGTEAQTFDVLTKISNLLKTQGMTMGDVVMMRVFLQVDPDKGGHADRAGMNAAFKKFFGTPEQPNKPSRTTIAVTDGSGGRFVEIDAVAAKVK